MIRRIALAAVLVACGGAPQPTAIPAQPAPIVVPTAAASASEEPAAVAAKPEPPPPPTPEGAGGPSDARGMIGPLGELEGKPHRATMLVNSALVRQHPSAKAMTRVLTGVMAEWDAFMPYAVVHPTRDLDWIVVSGSLIAGTTERNVNLARYNLSEPKADVATAALMKQLRDTKKIDVGVPGTKAFVATVETSPRAYLRPKPGMFAIVPASQGKTVAETMKRADEPKLTRPGELFRVAYTSGPKLSMLRGLVRARIVRLWGVPEGAGVVVHAEAEYAGDDAAEAARDEADGFLRQLTKSPIARIAVGAALERARIWRDGATVRLRLELNADEIERLGAAACMIPGGSVCVE